LVFPACRICDSRSNSPIRKGRSLEPCDSETKIINQLRWISGFTGVHAVAMQLFRNPNKSFQLYFVHGTLLFQEAKMYSNITINKKIKNNNRFFSVPNCNKLELNSKTKKKRNSREKMLKAIKSLANAQE
jgi:hypothetical protein